MYPAKIKAITFIELIIAIGLLVVIVLGFSSIELFSRHHVLTSDRRAQIQNEAAVIMEHMSKEIGQGIGDTMNSPVVSVSGLTAPDHALSVWVDSNHDGRFNSTSDSKVIYWYNNTSHEMRYNSSYAGALPVSYEVLGRKVSGFNHSYNTADNYIEANVSACWNPAQANCGTPDNPNVTLRNRIKMPAVSVH